MKLREWIGLIVIAILAVLLLSKELGCNKTVHSPSVVTTTTEHTVTPVIKHDTEYVPIPSKSGLIYIPYHTPVTIGSVNGSKEDYGICPPVTIRNYTDTIHLDSSGSVVVHDSIQGINLKRRLEFNISNHTITVTNTVHDTTTVYKNRFKVLVGVDAIGNRDHVVSYVGGRIAFQFKSGTIIEGGAGYWGDKAYYKAGVLIPIKLRK